MDWTRQTIRMVYAADHAAGGASRFMRPLVPGIPSRVVDPSGVVKRQDRDARAGEPSEAVDPPEAHESAETGKGELVVGPEITFIGEIRSCDTLIVHGRVEAAMPARALHIGPTGLYSGTAEVTEAEVTGRFEGTLTARRLFIATGGQVSGKVRYAELEVAAGGRLHGDVGLLDEPEAAVTQDEHQEEEPAAAETAESEPIPAEAEAPAVAREPAPARRSRKSPAEAGDSAKA